jgi:hypothetical protein
MNQRNVMSRQYVNTNNENKDISNPDGFIMYYLIKK